MACSSGDATVSAMVFGFAPGYVARTTMVGGTTSGYSLMGSRPSAVNPTMKITTESTPAKIGRRIKKWEKFIGSLRRGGLAFRQLRAVVDRHGFLRRDWHPGTDALQAVNDHHLTCVESGTDNAFAVDNRTELHRAILDGVR